MAELIDRRAVEYAEAHSTPSPDYLAAVATSTKADFPMWGMMVGRQEGRFLELLVFALGAERVLEIGAFTGYSSISMAAGLPEGGRITTLDLDPHHVETTRRNIAASPYGDRIEVLEGPAIETLEGLPGPFDFVFIDADKTGYDAYYEAVLPKLAPRGLIALDNMLFAGGVLDETNDNESAVALRRLNDKLAADPRVVVAFTTIRDGVTLVRRAGA